MGLGSAYCLCPFPFCNHDEPFGSCQVLFMPLHGHLFALSLLLELGRHCAISFIMLSMNEIFRISASILRNRWTSCFVFLISFSKLWNCLSLFLGAMALILNGRSPKQWVRTEEFVENSRNSKVKTNTETERVKNKGSEETLDPVWGQVRVPKLSQKCPCVLIYISFPYPLCGHFHYSWRPYQSDS